MNITLADKLSVLPVIQQGIGVVTVLSNIILVIVDLAKSIFGQSYSPLKDRSLHVLALVQEREKTDKDLSVHVKAQRRVLEQRKEDLIKRGKHLESRDQELLVKQEQVEEVEERCTLSEEDSKQLAELDRRRAEALAKFNATAILSRNNRGLKEYLADSLESEKAYREFENSIPSLRFKNNVYSEIDSYNLDDSDYQEKCQGWIKDDERLKKVEEVTETHQAQLSAVEFDLYEKQVELNQILAKLDSDWALRTQWEELRSQLDQKPEKMRLAEAEIEELASILKQSTKYLKILEESASLQKQCQNIGAHLETLQAGEVTEEQEAQIGQLQSDLKDAREALNNFQVKTDEALTFFNKDIEEGGVLLTIESLENMRELVNISYLDLADLKNGYGKWLKTLPSDEQQLEKDSEAYEEFNRDLEATEKAYQASLAAHKIEMEKLKKISLTKIKNKPIHEHLKNIGIGLLRMIPLGGTVYSAVVWSKAKTG